MYLFFLKLSLFLSLFFVDFINVRIFITFADVSNQYMLCIIY